MTPQEFLEKLRAYLPTLGTPQGCTPALARPARDWQLLLVGAAILFIGASVFAGFMYTQTIEEPNSGVEVGVAGPVVDESVFSQIATLLQDRAQRHKQVQAQ